MKEKHRDLLFFIQPAVGGTGIYLNHIVPKLKDRKLLYLITKYREDGLRNHNVQNYYFRITGISIS